MRTGVILTGGSRGFGRFLSLDLCRQVEGDLDLFLWARSLAGLQETEKLVQQEWANKPETKRGSLQTSTLTVDLSSPSDYVGKADSVFQQVHASKYDRVFLIHNAGSLGELCYTQEWSSHEMLEKYFAFNVTSVFWLNKRFLDLFGASRHELQQAAAHPFSTGFDGPSAVIVNITSFSGLQPFLTENLYCTGKAAREMHHRVIALEQKPCPKLRVFNYSPGPMDTDMQACFRESDTVHESMKETFIAMKEQGHLIRPEDTSSICIKLLLAGEFESGSHVDYYAVTGTKRMHAKD